MSDVTRDRILRIRGVQEKIRHLLLDEWDPIGICDVAMAQDEYDRYVGRVYVLIVSRRGSFPIAQLLFDIEISQMGLTNRDSPIRLEPLAQRLAALADELGAIRHIASGDASTFWL